MNYDLTDGFFTKPGEKIFEADFPEQILFSDSIRAIRNELMFWEEHLALIQLQFQLLNRPLPDFLKNDAKGLKRQIERALVKNKLFKSSRIDLFLFGNRNCSYLVRTKAIESTFYELNDEGLVICIFDKTFKTGSPLSSLRMGSAPYWKIMKAFAVLGHGEPILLNGKGCLLEASERNLYLIQGTSVHTASPETGVYMDPSRSMISNICKKAGLGFQEHELLTADDLLLADEAFLAGDLYGIQWIKAYESKRYLNKTIRLLNEQLNTIVSTKQP